ncbi:hypothetical protein [Photobacterium kishitanii]|uniref:hypothetical protein n=1 Tax=Photobacterium kishitanii TaxID=318456 RepID=UPI0004327F54|nr:hypothetical protein [Photobacterium kishitanii]CEO41985.1 hypothetical protein PPBDW_II1316 [Photobacterium kishitanii]
MKKDNSIKFIKIFSIIFLSYGFFISSFDNNDWIWQALIFSLLMSTFSIKTPKTESGSDKVENKLKKALLTVTPEFQDGHNKDKRTVVSSWVGKQFNHLPFAVKKSLKDHKKIK